MRQQYRDFEAGELQALLSRVAALVSARTSRPGEIDPRVSSFEARRVLPRGAAWYWRGAERGRAYLRNVNQPPAYTGGQADGAEPEKVLRYRSRSPTPRRHVTRMGHRWRLSRRTTPLRVPTRGCPVRRAAARDGRAVYQGLRCVRTRSHLSSRVARDLHDADWRRDGCSSGRRPPDRWCRPFTNSHARGLGALFPPWGRWGRFGVATSERRLGAGARHSIPCGKTPAWSRRRTEPCKVSLRSSPLGRLRAAPRSALLRRGYFSDFLADCWARRWFRSSCGRKIAIAGAEADPSTSRPPLPRTSCAGLSSTGGSGAGKAIRAGRGSTVSSPLSPRRRSGQVIRPARGTRDGDARR